MCSLCRLYFGYLQTQRCIVDIHLFRMDRILRFVSVRRCSVRVDRLLCRHGIGTHRAETWHNILECHKTGQQYTQSALRKRSHASPAFQTVWFCYTHSFSPFSSCLCSVCRIFLICVFSVTGIFNNFSGHKNTAERMKFRGIFGNIFTRFPRVKKKWEYVHEARRCPTFRRGSI